MRTLCLEIRDSMTFIPVVAMDTKSFNPERDQFGSLITPDVQQRMLAKSWLLRRAGYSMNGDTIILINLNDCRASNEPYGWWNSRTMQVAHAYIAEHWSELKDGDVIDVEFILG